MFLLLLPFSIDYTDNPIRQISDTSPVWHCTNKTIFIIVDSSIRSWRDDEQQPRTHEVAHRGSAHPARNMTRMHEREGCVTCRSLPRQTEQR